MPGRISYNGIHVNFQNEWVRFNPRLASNASHVQAMSGVTQTVQFFDQEFISTEMRLAPGQDEIQLQRFFEYANDGSTFELWRNRDLGTYISFEGGGNSATVPTITPRGLQTNDKVAGTFTHTAVADSQWYLDPSTGLMTVVPTTNNIPRFEAGKYGQHAVRVDGAAANLITHPSALDNAAWSKVSTTIAANTTETLDPSGANAADKVTATGAGGVVTFATSTAVGNDAAMGIWLKCQTGTVVGKLGISGTGSGSDEVAITVTPEWQRFTHTADTSAFTTNLQFGIQIDTNTEIMYAWGAAGYDSANSDLGTVGALSTSAITRGVEKLTFPSANIINRDKGTVSMWFKPLWDSTNLATNFALFQSGASESVRHLSFVITTAPDIQVRLYRNNLADVGHSLAGASTGIVQDAWNHLVVTYDGSLSNGLILYLAGAQIAINSQNSINVSEVDTTFSIGSLVAGTNPAFCAFDEVIITKDVKSAAWVQQIFSRTQAIGEGRNYWSSVRLSNLNYARQALRGGRSTIPLEFEEVL